MIPIKMIQTRQNELQGRGLLSYKRRKIWIIIDAIRIDAALIPQQAIIMQLCRAPRARRVFLGLRGRRDPDESVARRAHRGLKENRAALARQVRGEWPDCRARVDPKVYAVI